MNEKIYRNPQIEIYENEGKRHTEEKQKLIDDFREKLVGVFLRKCNYNDFSKLCLITIVETIDKIYADIERGL